MKIFIDELKLDNTDIQKISSCFESGDANRIISELKTNINTVLSEKGDFSEKLQQIKGNREDLQKKKSELQRIKKLYTDVVQLIDDSFDSRRNYNTTLGSLENKMKVIDDKKNLGGQTEPGMYSTRLGEINPRVLGALPEKSPDLSFLDTTDEGKQEIEKLKNLVNQKIKEVIDVRKMGISNFIINFETKVKKEAWSFETASMVISSPSPEISKWVSNSSEVHKRTIQKMLGLSHDDDAKVKTHTFTKPWEVSLSFFATASFLDNISPMIAGGGYWEKYEKNRNNLLHHVLLLQQGNYIIRNNLLKLNEAAEKANLERFEKDDTNKGQTIQEVLALYKEKTLQDAIKK